MKEYMEEKYLLIKTSILEVEEIKDNLCSKCVELTEEDIHTLWDSCQTAIYECSPGKEPPIQSVQGKIGKVLNDEKD